MVIVSTESAAPGRERKSAKTCHRGLPYRREIDGLRAVAVLPVILFHAGFSTFSGGFVGVDVFFVISGYLITSLIVAEKEAGTFSLIGFYERRARRILPALFLVMLACIPFAWIFLFPSDVREFAQSLVSVSTFSSNFLFSQQSGYFYPDTPNKPLLHTWSLSVEEQYYLLFPLVIILAWRLGKRWMILLLAAVCIVSLGISEWQSLFQPQKAFFLLPARGWELLLGGFAAFYLLGNNAPSIRSPRASQVLSLAGVMMIFAAVFSFDEQTIFPGLHALLPAAGAVFVILFATPETLTGKVLGSKAAVGIGLISYSAYLWHQPLFAFARQILEAPPLSLFCVLSVLALLLAYLSWKYVESPFRRRSGFSRSQVFAFAGVGTTLFLAAGIYGWASGGIVRTFDGAEFVLIRKDVAGRYNSTNVEKSRLRDFDNSGKPAVLIIGDSFAGDLTNAVHESGLLDKIQISTFRIAFPCGNLDLPDEIVSKTIQPSAQARCAKEKKYSDEKLQSLLRRADSIWLVSCWTASTAPLLEESVRNLERDFGRKVIVFGNKWFGTVSLRKFYLMDQQARLSYRAPITEEERAPLQILRHTFGAKNYVDVASFFCENDECRVFTEDGKLISHDGRHLTADGARYLGGKLEHHPLVKTIIRRPFITEIRGEASQTAQGL
jgi:peptidoglycan/LPS O-acetylase OafA/YrhL